MLVDAVVTAGGIPKPGEPLYPLTQGRSKAWLEIAGQPMIQWVLDALGEARTIRRVVVMGLDEGDAPLQCRKTISFLPNQGSLLANVEAGLKWVLDQDAGARHALVVSSDIPTITPAAVDWVVETSLQTDHDVYYSLIPQVEMERRFPGSRRSYFRLKDGTFTGGDMTLVATALVKGYDPRWQAIIEARKNVFKQASLIGFDTLFLLATRQLSSADAVKRASERLGLNGRVLICPYPEAGMDVDKPAQYELVRRALEARRGAV